MDIVITALGAVAFALALISLLVPFSDELGLPLPVVIAIVGLLLGSLGTIVGTTPSDFGLHDEASFLDVLALESQHIIFLFLPPLLYEMALAVNVRRLLEDLPIVILMAVIAVVTATVFVGGALFLSSGLSFVVCLLLGATISTTDPAAVITVFKKLGAPKRLLVVLEGESLLNDAAAIALFSILLASIATGESITLSSALFAFIYNFAIGAFVGVALAYVAARTYPLLNGSVLAETSCTVAVAYGAFLVAELGFGASGVVAVVMAGVTTVVLGSVRMGPGNWTDVTTIWAQIGFFANGLIFLIGSLLIPTLMANVTAAQLALLIFVVIGAFGARAAVLFVMLPVLSRFGLSAPMTRGQRTLIWWGAVRGAVTLILTLSLTESDALTDNEQSVLGVLGSGFVLFTLLVNAATLAKFTSFLGLDQLSKGDQTLRSRIVAGSMRDALSHVQDLAEQRSIDVNTLTDLRHSYDVRVHEMELHEYERHAPFGERLRLGLTILANQEGSIVRRQFESGVIGPTTTRLLRVNAERLADAARLDGREGYERVMEENLEFSGWFGTAITAQRVLGVERPLARLLERRFDLLFETETLVRELVRFCDAHIDALIGDDARDNLAELMDKRQEMVVGQREALELQYPHYADGLRSVFLHRAGLRWEAARYNRLFEDGIVGEELHRTLKDEAEKLMKTTRRLPSLDVGLAPATLIAAVPIFRDLDSHSRDWLTSRLSSHLAAPGDFVVRAGERGNEMYFVGSGVLEVRIGEDKVRLASGDFFGELAMIGPTRRRTADVVALGFCRLLVLSRNDFHKLLEMSPEVSAQIHHAVSERVEEGDAYHDDLHHADPHHADFHHDDPHRDEDDLTLTIDSRPRPRRHVRSWN